MTDPKKTPAEKRAEAEKATSGWPKRFTWKGIRFVIASPDDWPLKAVRAFELGHVIDALAGVIGDANWARIENMPTGETRELFEKITAIAGFEDAGE